MKAVRRISEIEYRKSAIEKVWPLTSDLCLLTSVFFLNSSFILLHSACCPLPSGLCLRSPSSGLGLRVVDNKSAVPQAERILSALRLPSCNK